MGHELQSRQVCSLRSPHSFIPHCAMSVVFLTRDLVFSSRLATVAERLGIVSSTVTSLEAAAARLSNGTVKLVVVDLSTGEVDVKEIVCRLPR